jgi:hypothetical protein
VGYSSNRGRKRQNQNKNSKSQFQVERCHCLLDDRLVFLLKGGHSIVELVGKSTEMINRHGKNDTAIDCVEKKEQPTRAVRDPSS